MARLQKMTEGSASARLIKDGEVLEGKPSARISVIAGVSAIGQQVAWTRHFDDGPCCTKGRVWTCGHGRFA